MKYKPKNCFAAEKPAEAVFQFARSYAPCPMISQNSARGTNLYK